MLWLWYGHVTVCKQNIQPNFVMQLWGQPFWLVTNSSEPITKRMVKLSSFVTKKLMIFKPCHWSQLCPWEGPQILSQLADNSLVKKDLFYIDCYFPTLTKRVMLWIDASWAAISVWGTKQWMNCSPYSSSLRLLFMLVILCPIIWMDIFCLWISYNHWDNIISNSKTFFSTSS